MKLQKEKEAGTRRGKRILCRMCMAAVLGICLLQHIDGAYFFPAQDVSVCERVLKEGGQAKLSGRVFKKSMSKDRTVLYLSEIELIGPDIRPRKTDEHLLIYLSEETYPSDSRQQVPKIGERVTVYGTVGFFQESPNPGNFNQKFYYQKQNIHAALWESVIEAGDSEAVRITDLLREWLWQFRLSTAEEVCSYAGSRQGGILCSMLLGETAYAEDDLLEEYRQSGIGHLLAVSGLHVSFIGMGLYAVMRKAGVPILPSAFVGSVVLCLYVILSGASVSAVRACVMFLIRMGAAVTGREYDGLTALSAAALFILGRNPLMLFDAGFLLSFGAVLGIYLTAPFLWEKRKEEKQADKLRIVQWASGIKRQAADTLRLSFAMQLTVLPVMLYYYYETCVYSMAWNLVVVPMAGSIFACALAGIFLNQAGLWLNGSVLWKVCAPMAGILKKGAEILFGTAALGLRFYEWGSGKILELPGARWVAGQPSRKRLMIYYLLLLSLAALCFLARRRKRKAHVLFPAQVFCVCLAIAVLASPHGKRGSLEAVMLNVGQGDGFFIRGPSGNTYLIDGGSSSVSQVGKYRLEPFLKSQGVGSLDYVFISHGDMDHVNGVMELLDRQRTGVKIRHLVLPPAGYWDERLYELAQAAWEKGIPVLSMETGQRFSEGKLHITCLWPEAEEEAVWEPGNETSMVLSVTFGEFDMLFTGDLEKEGEAAVTSLIAEMREKGELPESYELLKAGHHGSKNASQETFLEVVSPKAAWISAGERNRYGHPHAEVLERLANIGAKLYNTKDGSAVMLYTDGERYNIRMWE